MSRKPAARYKDNVICYQLGFFTLYYPFWEINHIFILLLLCQNTAQELYCFQDWKSKQPKKCIDLDNQTANLFVYLSSSSHARSLRENWTVPGEQASEEKENDHKEMYPQPLLQWVLHLWSSLWADSGTNLRATPTKKKKPLLVRPAHPPARSLVHSLACLPAITFLRSVFWLWWILIISFSLGLVNKRFSFVYVCVCVGVVMVDSFWVLSSTFLEVCLCVCVMTVQSNLSIMRSNSGGGREGVELNFPERRRSWKRVITTPAWPTRGLVVCLKTQESSCWLETLTLPCWVNL